MVDWLQKRPEVIAYLRSQYTPEALPDWVWELDNATPDDYREIVRREGLPLPTMEEEPDQPTQPNQPDDEEESMEEDIAEGTIPVWASIVGDFDPKSGMGPSKPIQVG